MRRNPLCALVFFLATASVFAQQLPRCDDDECRAIRTILEAAPSGFAHWRGQVLGSSGSLTDRRSTYQPPFFPSDICFIRVDTDSGKASFICPTSKLIGGPQELQGQSLEELFNSLVDAARRAVPGWVEKESTQKAVETTGELPFYNFMPLHCERSYAISLLSVSLGELVGHKHLVLMVDQNYCVLNDDDLPRLPGAGEIVIKGAPPNAAVALDGIEKGTTGADGTLVMRGLRPQTFKLTLTSEGYKPFSVNADASLGAAGAPIAVHMEGIPLSERDVEDGLKKGITSTRMQKLVSDVGVDFDLTSEVAQRLRAAGGDSDLLVIIATSKKK